MCATSAIRRGLRTYSRIEKKLGHQYRKHNNQGLPVGVFTKCRYCGTEGPTVCDTCRNSIRKAKRPANQGVALTDEVKAEIRRRLSRFESPTSIARALGLSHHQMTDFLHPNRKRTKK